LNIFICFLFFILFIFFISIQTKALNYWELENIQAISAVVLDGKSGKLLFAKNPHLKIPPASTTKLVTAMVVLDKISLNKKVKISKNVEHISSVTPYLYAGEIYTVKDLLYLALLNSSNQAAVALAEAVAGSEKAFVKLMNEKVKSLGLKETHFSTASGLPAPYQYTTAYDLAIILYEALKYPLIKKIIRTPKKIITSSKGRVLVLKNTNHLLKDPEIKKEIIGGKTGYTRMSRHCLVNAVSYNNRLIITSILGDPERDYLWEDTKKLVEFSKLVLSNKLSPVLIKTSVNTAILASKKFKYYVNGKKYFKKYKNKHYKLVKE
ncbi:MAG: hypothetical protein DRP29_07755, partial [Thermodesulfobacteriota bacterium]